MILQSETTPLQGIKLRSLKSRKIDIFPKELTHGFGQKMAIFRFLFFRQNRPEKCFFVIFQNGKTFFQSIKTRSSKRRRNDIFPNHGFGPKIAIFCTFFFQALQARKTSFMIFYNEKTPFWAIKRRSSKSQKIDILTF